MRIFIMSMSWGGRQGGGIVPRHGLFTSRNPISPIFLLSESSIKIFRYCETDIPQNNSDYHSSRSLFPFANSTVWNCVHMCWDQECLVVPHPSNIVVYYSG
jgi:hypothetical protein